MTAGRPRPRSTRKRSRPDSSRASSPAPSTEPRSAPIAPESRIRAALWTTIPAALATELGALAAIGFGALPGITVGIVGVILLDIALRRFVPRAVVVRGALLVGGPPLRYGLLLVAVWYEWIVRGSGPGPALATGLLLAFVVPLIGSVLAAPRGRSLDR